MSKSELAKIRLQNLQDNETARNKEYLEKYPLGAFHLYYHNGNQNLYWYGSVTAPTVSYGFRNLPRSGKHLGNKPQYKHLDLRDNYNEKKCWFHVYTNGPIKRETYEIVATYDTKEKLFDKAIKVGFKQDLMDYFEANLNESFYPYKKLLHQLNQVIINNDLFVDHNFTIRNIVDNEIVMQTSAEHLEEDLTNLFD